MNFFAPSAPSHYAKFVTPGDSIQGYIEEISEPFPVKDYKKDTPKLDPKGNPVMQVRIILATPESVGEGDDGRRSLYVSAKRMSQAIGDAMRRAGEAADSPQPGAYLKVTFARVGESSGGMAPPKLYVAEYTKPPAAAQSAPPTQAAPQSPTPPWGASEGAGPAPW
ncbi:hypothetical protein GCM10020221_11450 [Streptomyces thioluteus]|uniref:Uncharacterized protein n=1 Tax=Streptomyces thioluteus TaxID=66431 RepID=A0ABN3WJL5_STRTU